MYSILGIPIARLADRGNRRLIITLGLLGWSAMTMLSGAARNVYQLAAARLFAWGTRYIRQDIASAET